MILRTLRRRLGHLLQPLFGLCQTLGIAMRPPHPPKGQPAVSYGRRRLPSREEATFGGMIKCQALQDAFPHTPREFNLLYLVSSRLPLGAVQLVRSARRHGVPLVWNQNGVFYPSWYGHGWQARNAPLAALHREAAHVFYQSAFCRDSAVRFLGRRSTPSEILYNPVNTQTFLPAGHDPNPKEIVMLVAGTHTEFYRVSSAMEVLARLRAQAIEARLIIAGRLAWARATRARRHADALADAFNLTERITYLGPYTQAEAPNIFRQAHVLLHAQVNDCCPTVVLEAMACGLPVVYSNSGGVPELVGPHGGLGVEQTMAPNPEAMTHAVLLVMEKRSFYAEEARARAVEHFDLARWIARHRTVFEQVVA